MIEIHTFEQCGHEDALQTVGLEKNKNSQLGPASWSVKYIPLLALHKMLIKRLTTSARLYMQV